MKGAHYTFNALISLPLAMATHSPVVVEIPLPIAIPCMIGDHAKLVTWLDAVYAMMGSDTTRFLTSGRGEFKRDPVPRGEVAF